MKNILSDDEIGRWLRNTADELFAIAQWLDNEEQIQGPEAQKELEKLDWLIERLQPCGTPPQPQKSGRFHALTPLELRPELLDEIGLRREDLGSLISQLPMIKLYPDKLLSSGARSILKQMEEHDAAEDRIEKTRLALANLDVLRNFLK